MSKQPTKGKEEGKRDLVRNDERCKDMWILTWEIVLNCVKFRYMMSILFIRDIRLQWWWRWPLYQSVRCSEGKFLKFLQGNNALAQGDITLWSQPQTQN